MSEARFGLLPAGRIDQLLRLNILSNFAKNSCDWPPKSGETEIEFDGLSAGSYGLLRLGEIALVQKGAIFDCIKTVFGMEAAQLLYSRW